MVVEDRKRMNMKLSYLKIFILCTILICLIFTGSIEQAIYTNKQGNKKIQVNWIDTPLILPEWNDGEYHDYYTTCEKLIDFNNEYPDLISIKSIGKSILDKDIFCIKITNENSIGKKYSCLYDGCIHGNEWEGGEACLYFAEYLLINFGKNNTITTLLNISEVNIVPLVNPDGRQKDMRHNHYGIDVNRNFDVNFGDIRGGSLPVGRWFPFKWMWVPFPPHWLVKVGRHPFSEPESRALKDLMMDLNNHNFSFYLTLHTATHYFSCPSDNIINSDYEMSEREVLIHNYAKSWVENNTEYKATKDHYLYGRGYSNHYCFKEYHIPSFCLEALNPDYEPGYTPGGRHDHLVHWMNTTLPIFMYLLVNIEKLYNWDIPDIYPPLPEGVPPPPLK